MKLQAGRGRRDAGVAALAALAVPNTVTLMSPFLRVPYIPIRKSKRTWLCVDRDDSACRGE